MSYNRKIIRTSSYLEIWEFSSPIFSSDNTDIETNQVQVRLELQYELLDNERIELLKIVSDFEYRHSVELGELILKILKLRKNIKRY